jgi:hypothetical protein
MAAEFAVHPFEALIDYRALCLPVFRKLLETTLKDWAGILKSTIAANNSSSMRRFHLSISACSRKWRPKRFGSGWSPPSTDRWRPIRRGMNRRQVRALAHHRTSSSRGIPVFGFARPKCQCLRTRVRPDGDSVPRNDCRASWDERFNSSKTRWNDLTFHPGRHGSARPDDCAEKFGHLITSLADLSGIQVVWALIVDRFPRINVSLWARSPKNALSLQRPR